MGQGTDSCGGYEVDFDEYEDGLINGDWTQRDGSKINVKHMPTSQLNGCIVICNRMEITSNFECDKEKWSTWVDILNNELSSRSASISVKKEKKSQNVRGSKVLLRCHCGSEYRVRQADLNRGWGKSCSKSCAAIKRDFGRPDPVRL